MAHSARGVWLGRRTPGLPPSAPPWGHLSFFWDLARGGLARNESCALVLPRGLDPANDSDMATSMTAFPGEPSLSKEQRCALTLLARIPHGITKNTLVLAHGFDRTMVAGLVDAGLVAARREVVASPGRSTTKVVRIKIRNAGGRVIEG
jgi:hypothetical protein